ncbi:MAG: class I SAM-dependent methyltransferase [Bacteroidota bacterium]
MKDYLSINQKAWNIRTEAHWNSQFYDVKGWLSGQTSLKEIELALLPKDLSGLRVLHLFCHFGQDTLSLARMGAEVTGVDLSDQAIKRARELAGMADLEARFINTDVLSLKDKLDEAGSFDLVFQSYGTIGWLPELDEWAKTVAHFLKPGGQLIFAEFHPVVWMLDDHDRTKLGYPYFNLMPIHEDNEQSYTDGSDNISYSDVSWNHGLGDVLGVLLKAGLRIDDFQEYDYSPYPCFSDAVAVGDVRWQLKGIEGQIPMVYSVLGRRG